MRVISFLAVLAAAATACAQTNILSTGPARILSLQDCIQMALQGNTDLQIWRYDPVIAMYNLKSTYGVYDPILDFSGQHDHDEAGFRILGGGFTIPGSTSDVDSFTAGLTGYTPWGMTYAFDGTASDSYGRSFDLVGTNVVPRAFENSIGNASLTVRQPLLRNFWIDSNRLSIQVSKNRLKWSALEWKRNLELTITQLETAYNNLIFNRENVVVQQKAVELAEKLVVENTVRLSVGNIAQLDARQAESQAASSRADLIQALADLAVQEHTLKALILSNYAEWAGLSVEPSGTLMAVKQEFSLQKSWTKGLNQRPEILEARLDVERAGIQLKFDRNQLYPQLDLFGTYGYNGSGTEFSGTFYDIQQRDRPVWTYGGSISLPLANYGPRNAVKSSKATLQQMVLNVKRWERDIMKEIDDDIKLAQAGFERVGATRAAREFAEEALAAEQIKLQAGRSTTYTVLQMQRDLTSRRGDEIQAMVNYNNSLSQLSWHEGSTLERLQIKVEIK